MSALNGEGAVNAERWPVACEITRRRPNDVTRGREVKREDERHDEGELPIFGCEQHLPLDSRDLARMCLASSKEEMHAK